MSDPLSVAASVIAVVDATIKILKYLNDVKDAPKDRMDCKRELTTLYSLFLSLQYRLNTSDPSKKWYEAVQTLGIENGPLAQYSAILEELWKKISKDGKVIGAIKWKFTKEDVVALMAKMEQVKNTIQVILQLDLFELSKATKEDTEQIRDDTQAMKIDSTRIKIDATEIKSKVASIHSSIQQHHYSDTLVAAFDWISPTNYPARQAGFLDDRQSGTGTWFLQSAEFEEWRQKPRGRLLCTGMPGAGKTILAATVINNLGGTLDLDRNGVAYVFCNYKDQMNTKRMDPMAAILKQLVQNKPTSSDPLLKLYHRHHNSGTYPTPNEISDALVSVLSDYTSVFLIVDALDECPDDTRSKLLARLSKVQDQADVRVLMTSRPVPEVVEAMTSTPRVDVRANDTDVRVFVAERVQKLPKKATDDQQFVEWVIETIVTAVDGMFLLARYYVDRLAGASNKRQIKTALASLQKPTENDNDAHNAYFRIYEETKERISAQPEFARDLARKALAWVILAKRPLTAQELCLALAVEPEDGDLDEDGESDITDILSACAGLITIEKETELVRFIHYTAQEYFDSIIDSWNHEAKTYIATTCLTFLRFESNRKREYALRPKTEWFDYVELRNVLFLAYPVIYWPDHIAPCEEKMTDDILTFLEDDEVRNNMVIRARRVWWRHAPSSGQLVMFDYDATPLHIIASLGSVHLFHAVLKARPEVDTASLINAKVDGSRTPLLTAVEQGNLEIARLLLERDDLEPNSISTGTIIQDPLLIAAAKGYTDIVTALLSHKNFDFDAKDQWDDGYVHRAAMVNRLDIVQLLIEKHDVNADRPNKRGEAPLFHAVKRGHEDVVRYLLARDDVRIDRSGGYIGMTVLHEAASKGKLGIVQSLLKRGGIDINVRDAMHGKTPLHWAVWKRAFDVAKYLASQENIDIEARDKKGLTCLASAVIQGTPESVRFCIEELHANIHTKDDRGRSLFLIAMENRKAIEVINCLAEQGLDVNEKDGEGKTLLVHWLERGFRDGLDWLAGRKDVDWDTGDAVLDEKAKVRLEEYRKKAKG